MFCRENFDDEWPFHPDVSDASDQSTTTESSCENNVITCETFQELTKETFSQFVKEIKVCIFVQNFSEIFIKMTTVHVNYIYI